MNPHELFDSVDVRRIFVADARLGEDDDPVFDWCRDVCGCHPERATDMLRALQYHGLWEDAGSNRDKEGHIERWVTAAGGRIGDPWCAAYASDFLPAGERRAMGAMILGRRYPRILEADLALFDFMFYPTNDRGNGHVERVLGRIPGQVMTIGGNSENGVRVQRRMTADGLLFSRAPYPVQGNMPGIIATGTRLVTTNVATR